MPARPFRFFSLVVLSLVTFGCSSDPDPAAPAQGQTSGTGGSMTSGSGAGGGGGTGVAGAGGSGGSGGADVAPACAPPSPSHCKTPNEGSVVRGVARLAPGFVPPMGA